MSSKEKLVNTEPCNVCGVVIRYKADVPRHAQLHRFKDSVTMFICPYEGCTYQNLQKSNLNTHICTHTGEKPHACPECDWRTADPGSLTRHRKKLHGYEADGRGKAKPAVTQDGRHNAYKNRETVRAANATPIQSLPSSSSRSEGQPDSSSWESVQPFTSMPFDQTQGQYPQTVCPADIEMRRPHLRHLLSHSSQN